MSATRTARLLAALGPRPLPAPHIMAVLLDTREQTVGPIAADVAVIVRALPAGDLSLDGHETEIAIDRKAIDDFVRCLTVDRARFGRELSKLAEYKRAAIVVEATLRDVAAHRYRSKVAPAFVVSEAARIWTAYGVPVFFAGDLAASTDLSIRILRAYWRATREAKTKALEATLLGGAP
jgi:DNA excision repair protein ERCC-4